MCKTAVLHEADFIPLPHKLLAMSGDLSELEGGCCCHLLGSHLPLLLPTIVICPQCQCSEGWRPICGAVCPLSTSSTHCKLKCSKKGVYFCALRSPVHKLAPVSSVKILMLAGSVSHTFNPSTQQGRQRQVDLWDRGQSCLHGELQALQGYIVRLCLRKGGVRQRGERKVLNVLKSKSVCPKHTDSFIITRWIMECNDCMTFTSY